MCAQKKQDKKLRKTFSQNNPHPASLLNPRILLVEDSPIIQQVIQYFLEELGCHVTLAELGQEAIRLFPNGFDLILLDIGLPDIDGFEVARIIRNSQESHSEIIPIIGHTAYSLPEIIDSCSVAGMNAAHNKITTLEEMREILIRWLPPSLHPLLKEI